jgi:hypothetical protein
VQKVWHTDRCFWVDSEQSWEEFNNFSIPELVQSFGKFREVSKGHEARSRFWRAISHAMKTASRLIQGRNSGV